MNPSQPISVAELQGLAELDEAVIESLEQMLYRLLVKHRGQWFYVASEGKSLVARNLADLQRLLLGKQVPNLWLKHASAYDEMIGLAAESGTNTLLVPLGMPTGLER